jgi:DNA-binding CsgD family transcriptional regulator
MTSSDDRRGNEPTVVRLPNLLAQVHNRAAQTAGHDADAGAGHLSVWMDRQRDQQRAEAANAPSPCLPTLTDGQRKVALLVARGLTNIEVGEVLHLSPHTVDTHLRNIFQRLEINRRAALAHIVAMECGPIADGCIDSAERAITTRVPDDDPDGYVADFTKSGLENLLWKTADTAALQFTPLGPAIVRNIYLSRQLRIAVMALRAGEGLIFKIAIPGFDLPSGDSLPPGLQFAAHVRLAGDRDNVMSEPWLRTEIQICEPWFGEDDAEKADEASDPDHVPPAGTTTPRSAEPWRAWLSLIGTPLIRDLSRALSIISGVPFDGLEQTMLTARQARPDALIDLPGRDVRRRTPA